MQASVSKLISEIQSLRKSGRYDDALALLDRFSDPGNSRLLEERFNVVFAKRDVESTIEVGRRLQLLDPKYSIRILTQCGLLLRESGDAPRAVEYLKEAITIAGNDLGQLPEWFFATLYGANSDRKDWSAALEAALAGASSKPILYVWASHAQRALGNINGASRCLDDAIIALAERPDSAESVLSACRGLAAEHPCPETQQVLLRAQIAFGNISDAPLQLAEQAADSSDWKLLALICVKHINSGSKDTLSSALKGVTRAVSNCPEMHKCFLVAFERAISRQPCSQEIIFLTYDYLNIETAEMDAVGGLIAIQQRAPVLLPALVVEIARHGKLDSIRETCKSQISLLLRSQTYRKFERFLQGLCAHEIVSEDLVASILALHQSQLRQFLLFRQPALKALRPRDLKNGDSLVLAAAGVDATVVTKLFERLTAISPEYSAYLDKVGVSSQQVREKIRREESYTAFQDIIISDRRFDMVDPFRGDPAELFDSVMIFDRQLFSFRGPELFTFISGGNMNAGVCLFIVGANLLLQVDTERSPCSQNYYGSDIHMAELFAVYIERAAKNYQSYVEAISNAPSHVGRVRDIIAIHGRAENPAHHIWNYLSPFQRLKSIGLLGNISTIVRPPTEYFGDIRSLFPEVGTKTIISVPSQSVVDPRPFSLDSITVWLGGNFITRELQQRIHRWAINSIPNEKQKAIEALVACHKPIVWIGLRSGDKVWMNQTDGIVAVIDSISSEYHNSLFVLDGFSVTDGDTGVPDKWRPAFNELSVVAQEICRRVRVPGCTISLIGNSIAESVLWTRYVSIYFAPMGSSQHKVGWYCAAPGIVYTSSKIETVPSDLRPGAWESEGSPVPQFIIGTIANAGKRRGNFDFRSNIENVDFDTAAVIDLMRQNLAGLIHASPS